MKVLHLNSLETGGAAKAVKRIDYSLKKKINSEIFFFKNKKNIILNILSKPYSVIDKIISDKNNKSKDTTFSSNAVPFSFIPLLIKIKDPDIVHLHWINAGMINIKSLIKIKKPIVWTMHDYWPFSGGYHLPVDTSFENDLSNTKILKIKKKIYNKINKIKFIAVSKNLMNDAKSSELLQNKDISFINNPLNTKSFEKKDKSESKKKLDLNNDFTILFCSYNSIFKKNKNFQFLVKIINKFSLTNKVNLIICGEKNTIKNKFVFNDKIRLIETGFINLESELSTIYSAADITAIPSKKESFGQIASESCACGTPVIGLKNTGLTDIIDHKENGYICEKENVDEFIGGINWIKNQNIELITKKCQQSILKFSDDKISEEYLKVYNELINK